MKNFVDAEYLEGSYKEYLEADDLKYATFEYRFNKVMNIFRKKPSPANQPRILDVGCSNGRFIEVALKNSMNAWGVELSDSAIAAAKPEIRKRIYRGDANKIEEMGEDNFDIITAFDLLEHLFDPLGFLKSLRKIIAKDGIIIITTPDTGSFFRIAMGKAWPMLQPFQHTVLFSRKSAKILLEEAGFNGVYFSGTKKFFSPDYLFGQLKGLNPCIYAIYSNMKKIIPGFMRKNRISLNIGEIMIAASPIKYR
jgi:SAM-dependent methyltransferase